MTAILTSVPADALVPSGASVAGAADAAVAVAGRTRRRGQPSRYTEALRVAICRDIAQGVPVAKAFACNGISPRTGFNWSVRRPEFGRAVEAARLSYQRRWHPVL